MGTPAIPTLSLVGTQELFNVLPVVGIPSPLKKIFDRLNAHSPAFYAQVYAALTQSPYLLNEFNSLAASGALVDIELSASPIYTGQAQYLPGRATIVFGQNYVNTLSSVQKWVFALAHEGYHAQDNATLAPFISQTIGALENEIPSGQPVTTLLVTYASVLLADEANANLSGWNAAVGTLPQAKFGQKAGPTAADLSAIATESVRIGISNARPVQGCPQPCCA